MYAVGKMSLEVYLVHIVLARICIGARGEERLPLWQYLLIIAVTLLVSYPLSKLRGAMVARYVQRRVNTPIT
jgi:peptidoglycan/LPS O-acetylase OafA/YrhL